MRGRAELPPGPPDPAPACWGAFWLGNEDEGRGGLLVVARGTGAHIHRIILPVSHSFRHTHMMYTET